MRKLFSVIAICVIVLGGMCFPKTVQAQEQSESENNHERIEALYEERAQLSTDWEANRERIEEIDSLVLELGVTLATSEDLAKISNNKARMNNLSAFLGTIVTSERYTTNYNGQMLEVQVIRVVDDGTQRSELQISDSTATRVISNSEAVGDIFFKHILPTGLSHIPVVGDAFGTVLETVDIIEAINEEFSCNVTQVESIMMYTATSSEEWIYIKYAGSADSYQVLCYEGNRIDYNGTCVCVGTETDINGNGTVFDPYMRSVTGYMQSENYKDNSLAIKNFYFYKNYGTAFDYSQHLYSLSVVMLGTQYNFTFIPVAFSGTNV